MTSPLLDNPTPIPVEVAAVTAPIPVVMAQSSEPMPVVVTASEPVKRPEPTAAAVDQEKLKSQGQRRINLIWEATQSLIACAITAMVGYIAINGIDSEVLNNAFFLIVSMYFVRTNHQLIGGVGSKNNDDQDYRGR